MARSHGKLLASIWADRDWLALTADAQRLYMLLLSQPKMSLVGCIDWMPGRWARFASDTDIAHVQKAVDELEAAGLVVVDYGTEELLVRKMLTYDGVQTGNAKVVKGVWSAWNAISSAHLRRVVVHNAPAELVAMDATPVEARKARSEPLVSPERLPEPSPDTSTNGSNSTTTTDAYTSVGRSFERLLNEHEPLPTLPEEQVTVMLGGIGEARSSLRAALGARVGNQGKEKTR